MIDIVKLITIVLQLGVRLTLYDSGESFDPYYQERYYNELSQKHAEYNFEYSHDMWIETFKRQK